MTPLIFWASVAGDGVVLGLAMTIGWAAGAWLARALGRFIFRRIE